jgi:hypothetical protein
VAILVVDRIAIVMGDPKHDGVMGIEDALGEVDGHDALELLGRELDPLVEGAMGFLSLLCRELAVLDPRGLLRSTILDEPANWELALDMLRKLREDHEGYDATGLILASWNDDDFAGITIEQDPIPEDLRVDQLLSTLIARTLERTPVQFHVRARELRDARKVPVEEGVQPGTDEGDEVGVRLHGEQLLPE